LTASKAGSVEAPVPWLVLDFEAESGAITFDQPNSEPVVARHWLHERIMQGIEHPNGGMALTTSPGSNQVGDSVTYKALLA